MHALSHPQANRHITLHDGQQVGYLLRYSRRRTVGLQVNAEGLVITAPLRLPMAELNRILHTKADWIVRKLHAQSTQRPLAMQWGSGMELAYRGHMVRVHCTSRPHASLLPALSSNATPVPQHLFTPQPVAESLVRRFSSRSLERDARGIKLVRCIEDDYESILHVPMPNQSASWADAESATWLCAVIRRWLMQQARQAMMHSLAHYEALLGVRHSSLALSSARTRWGSASSRGAIRLHWRLIQLAPHLLDYVVAHELCHLREMNHSPRFWALVQSVCPDWRSHRQDLRHVRLPPWCV